MQMDYFELNYLY